MREDLLGYLLNALDDAERQRVFEALQKDPQLRQELEDLRRQLRPLDATNADFDPPAALAELTCDLVEGYAEEHPLAVPAQRQKRSVGWARVRSAACETCSPSGTWSAADTIVMAGVLVAVSLIFFPAIAGSRYRAQVAVCGDHLRNLGIALAGYSEHHQGYFPSIPIRGNRAVAGIYAVDAGRRPAVGRLADCHLSRLAPGGTKRRFPHPGIGRVGLGSRTAIARITEERGRRLCLHAGNDAATVVTRHREISPAVISPCWPMRPASICRAGKAATMRGGARMSCTEICTSSSSQARKASCSATTCTVTATVTSRRDWTSVIPYWRPATRDP